VGHTQASYQMSGFYPFEQKCGNLLIAHLPSEGEWLWLYASATVPKFGPNMNIEPLMHVLRSMCKADELPVPIQPGHILGKVRVVNIAKAHAKQKYPHIPLFPDVRQILHIVERLVLPNALAVSGLPRFDRWPQLNKQQLIDLHYAVTQAEVRMTSSSDEEDDDCKPPAAPNFATASASDDEDCRPPPAPKFKKQDDDDLLNDDDDSFSTSLKTPQPSQHSGIVSQSPLQKHPKSPRDVALLGMCEVIRESPLVMSFQSK
jgi:hypothetical protein